MNLKSIFIFSFLLMISFFFALTSCAGPMENLFVDKCSECHGENGGGKAAGTDLIRQKSTIEKIKRSIEHGKGEMTKFPEIQEPELTQLINYVAGLYQEN